MPQKRIYSETGGIYHITSRVNGKLNLFEDEQRAFLCRKIRAYSHFCGVEVFAYCAMGNHFHVLARPTEREDLSDTELFSRLNSIYREESMVIIKEEYDSYLDANDQKGLRAFRARYFARMWDISNFVKELKQCFSIWFNANFEREGTLWEGRFYSCLIEPSDPACAMVAAYIDLNPVRAGLAKDPKDYPFSSYGAAVAGQRFAQQALLRAFSNGSIDWSEIAPLYREMLVLNAGTSANRRGLPSEEIEDIVAKKGKLSGPELLACELRYFERGGAVGSPEFLESVINENDQVFPENRKSPGSPMRKGNFNGLWSIRQLQEGIVNPNP